MRVYSQAYDDKYNAAVEKLDMLKKLAELYENKYGVPPDRVILTKEEYKLLKEFFIGTTTSLPSMVQYEVIHGMTVEVE